MEQKTLKHYIPYVLAAVAGLFLRTICCALWGCSYTMDGHDLLNVVLFVGIVWCIKGIFVPPSHKRTERTKEARRPIAQTAKGNGACPCCGSLVNIRGRRCYWCGQALDWRADNGQE